jgi:hypothetical protein
MDDHDLGRLVIGSVRTARRGDTKSQSGKQQTHFHLPFNRAADAWRFPGLPR